MKALGKDFDYEIKENQHHVYVFYPTPEGQAARDKIIDTLNGK